MAGLRLTQAIAQIDQKWHERQTERKPGIGQSGHAVASTLRWLVLRLELQASAGSRPRNGTHSGIILSRVLAQAAPRGRT